MADQNFLNHLNRIRKTYRPNRRLKITPVVLAEMEFHLKEIGGTCFPVTGSEP
jgi:hypothetical protein